MYQIPIRCISHALFRAWNWPEPGALVSVISILSICLICICPGVHTVRVPEDERYLLGADGDGSDGAAAPNEPARDHRLHQILSAWVWRHQCQHWARPPPALHPQRHPGKSKKKNPKLLTDDRIFFLFSFSLLLGAALTPRRFLSGLSWHLHTVLSLFCLKFFSYQILCLYDSVDAIDVDKVVEYVKGLQQEDGSFAGDKWG